MDAVVLDDPEAVGAYVAGLVSRMVERDPALVLGVATGGTPLPVYRALARGSVDFSAVRVVALDEYLGLPPGHPASYEAYVKREIADPLGISPDDVVVPQGSGEELERQIAELGGVDLQLLGIGRNGHLAFNEPGSPLDSRSRVVTLAESTRHDNAAHVAGEAVPTHAITQGLGTILEARELVLLAIGAAKAEAVAAALTGPVTTDCPASVVQRHPRVTVVLDAAAASVVERRWVRRERGARARPPSTAVAPAPPAASRPAMSRSHTRVSMPRHAAQRDREPVQPVVAELVAERLERLLVPADDPALAEREVVGCVVEGEPKHRPLEVLGAVQDADESLATAATRSPRIVGSRVRQQRGAGGLGERRGQQLGLRGEVAIGGGARDAGRLGGVLHPRGVAALHQLPRGCQQLVPGALLLPGAARPPRSPLT